MGGHCPPLRGGVGEEGWGEGGVWEVMMVEGEGEGEEGVVIV